MGGCLERGMTRYSQKTKDEARALREQGLSYIKIANKLGISGPLVVQRWLDEGFRLRHNKTVRINRGYEA